MTDQNTYRGSNGWLWLFSVFQNKHFILKLNSEELQNTYMIPEPHLSHMGNFSALPTDDAIFVEGAFTLLNPAGLSESPTSEGGGIVFHLFWSIHNFTFYTPEGTLHHLCRKYFRFACKTRGKFCKIPGTTTTSCFLRLWKRFER